MDGTPYSIFDPGSELALVLREQAREIHDLLARREIWRSSILVDEHSGFRFGQLVMATDAQDSVFGRKRTFNLALHFFTVDENSATRSSIHDHRYPFAIHPCGPPSSTDPLYRMEWWYPEPGHPPEAAREFGVTLVRPGNTYSVTAVERWWHRIEILRPCVSLVLSDWSAGPTRAPRLTEFKTATEQRNTFCRVASKWLAPEIETWARRARAVFDAPFFMESASDDPFDDSFSGDFPRDCQVD